VAAVGILEEIVDRDDPAVVGVVLSGSAARGMATERSDLDVVLVLRDGADARETVRSPEVDVWALTLSELEAPGEFLTEGWYARWAFAWAQVLRDDTGGRVAEAVRRQATLTVDEQRHVLTAGDRLDGWVNFAYRALKSDRDGRPLEARLDAAESVPWLLDTVFTLAGRVRPYNKYLAWELREHPLPIDGFTAATLIPLVTRMLDGDVAPLREVFPLVDRAGREWDAAHGGAALGEMIDGWGSELDLFR
jgi:hypothetical protein